MAAEEVKKIEEEAIKNINKITSLINNRTVPPHIQNVSAASSAINEVSNFELEFRTECYATFPVAADHRDLIHINLQHRVLDAQLNLLL